MVGDVPITRYWLIPTEVRPKMFTPHPSMSSDEISDARRRSGTGSTTGARLEAIGMHAESESADGVYVLSKLYRQMYAGTGISTDSARRKKSKDGRG